MSTILSSLPHRRSNGYSSFCISRETHRRIQRHSTMKACFLFQTPHLIFPQSFNSNQATVASGPFQSFICASDPACFHSSVSVLYPIQIQKYIVSARKHKRRSEYKRSSDWIIELASMLAVNVKLLPQPLDLFLGEVSQRNSKGVYLELLKNIGGKVFHVRRRRRKTGLAWFVFVTICSLGLLYGRRVQMDVHPLFLLGFSLSLLGIGIRQLWRKRRIRNWVVGFCVWSLLLLSLCFKKEDLQSWIHRPTFSSPVMQIVTETIRKNRRH